MNANPAVGHVVWRDLVAVSRRETAVELVLALPWLAGSLFAASHGWWALALGGSFLFFFAGLRQVHNAYHGATGLSPRGNDFFLFAMSLAMQCSMHAVKVNHLRHHRHCMEAEDVEAMSARLSWWQALAIGPWFPVCLHRKALQVGTPAERGWIAAELFANAAWIGLVFFVLDVEVLRYHVAAMLIGECLTAFFAVWTVHHDCESPGPIARTLRRRWLVPFSYGMFFHLEHHLFPKVPTCHLATLARRLDEALPGYASRHVA